MSDLSAENIRGKINISASIVGAILEHSPHSSRRDAIRDIIKRAAGIKSAPNAIMQRGIDLEPEAVKALAFSLSVERSEMNNTLEDQTTYRAKLEGIPVSGTPDGDVVIDGKRYLLEVKCPVSDRRIGIENNLQYLDQVQMQMYCANASGLDVAGAYFYSYYPGRHTEPELIDYNPGYFSPGDIRILKEAHQLILSYCKDNETIKGILNIPEQVVFSPPEFHELLNLESQRDLLTKQIKEAKQRMFDRYLKNKNIIFVDKEGDVLAYMRNDMRMKLDRKALQAAVDFPLSRHEEAVPRPVMYSHKNPVGLDEYLKKHEVSRDDVSFVDGEGRIPKETKINSEFKWYFMKKKDKEEDVSWGD